MDRGMEGFIPRVPLIDEGRENISGGEVEEVGTR